MEIYIDGAGCIVGRLSSEAAKQALLGNKVYIFNAEQIVISGKKKDIIKKFAQKRARGEPFHGPFYPRMPDRILKRAIRGMISYKKPKGREALKLVKCYIGVPEEFKDKNLVQIKNAGSLKVQRVNTLTLKDICRYLGKEI